MAWSQREVCVLIEEYKKHPCLYAVKSKQYTNKHLRQKALEDVEAALISIKPHITINEIKTKFNGLKTTFAAEHKKHLQSFRSGAGNEDDIYTPKLWYYEKLKFLLDHIDTRRSIDSFQLTESVSQGVEETERNETVDDYILREGEDGSLELVAFNEETQNDMDLSQPPIIVESDVSEDRSSVYKHVQRSKHSQKRKLASSDAVVAEASNTLKNISNLISKQSNNTKTSSSVHNENDIAFSQFIVTKLKQISNDDIRLEVEETITRCLYDGIRRCSHK